jgi:hypothetical protein
MPILKEVIENHPFRVFVAASITAGTISAGIVAWFWNQSVSLKELAFQNQISGLKSEFGEQISDLKQRLISIERRVQGEKLYLDVSKIPIRSVDVPTLTASYKSFSQGKFFASPPTISPWTQTPASQLDLATDIFGERFGKMIGNMPGVGAVLSEKTGIMWRGGDVRKIILQSNTPLAQMDVREVRLRPFVFAMPVDSSLISRMAQGFKSLSTDKENEQGKIRARLEKLVVDVQKSGGGGNRIDSATGKESGQEAVTKNAQNVGIKEPEMDLVNLLSTVSRDDLAGFQFAVMSGGTFKVVATEKKGNVFYLRLNIVFSSAANVQKGGQAGTVVFDEEFFFIGTPAGGLLVRTGIPSTDLRSEAYVWTQAWLTSLRVPID